MVKQKKEKKILLSGLQPSGEVHIGNYLGAMKQFVDLQNEYESFFMIADYHALTTVQNAAKLSNNTVNLALDYLAVGLNPKKSVIFKQSDIPQHTELAWIFNCITSVAYLERAHAYKDALANKKGTNVGLFDYPILMAADILLYNTDVVPVGQDQKQHVEYARDAAEKFNGVFGKTFNIPKEYIIKEVAVVPGTDGRKMSKSYNNTIPLFAEDDEIQKAVMSIVTDSKGEYEPKDPTKDTIFALHKFFSKEQLPEIKKRYIEGDIGYKESKEILIESLKSFITPIRAKRKELEKDTGAVLKILKNGGKVARERAEAKMQEVRRKVGVSL